MCSLNIAPDAPLVLCHQCHLCMDLRSSRVRCDVSRGGGQVTAGGVRRPDAGRVPLLLAQRQLPVSPLLRPQVVHTQARAGRLGPPRPPHTRAGQSPRCYDHRSYTHDWNQHDLFTNVQGRCTGVVIVRAVPQMYMFMLYVQVKVWVVSVR